ncbi:DUF11 domain-containing protein [Qipengyuania nanhaisediminis]|uniref:DUF11 domain-containing protein n=1 Tax=Qipengyuania nanhaisediminis TaxID=604088 RepID=UPI0038B27CDC
MFASLPGALRALVIFSTIAIGMFSLAAQEARAQGATIDWADAGIASQGSLPSGTTATGDDGTVATVEYSVATQGGGSFDPAFAPTFVSYFSGTIGGAQSPLLSGFDDQSYDPRDKVTITISLDRAVTGLQFSLGDIDTGNFIDAVEVLYDDNAAGSFTNAAPTAGFWTTGSSVTRTNDATVDGWRGTANSTTASTNGNINFDFGSQSVQRIRIVYFSYTGSGDPSSQFLAISDFDYDAPGADLSLTKTLIGSPPVSGGSATWRLTASNAATSQLTANNVAVTDTFPSGFTFTSASGDGSFNSGSGVWSVGTLAPGASASLTITGTISSASGTSVTNIAEITASSAFDPDSTVNNGVASEDDYATATFTVQSGRQPGIPPVLSCPAGSSIFDWDAIPGWTDGSTDNTYAFASFGNIRFQISNDGVFLNSANFGGQTPTVHNYYSGGISPAEDSLHMLANQANQAGVATVTITLPRSFTGLQFSIFDVDFGNNQFADRVEVIGSNGGTNVSPILTNSNANYVSGNAVIGDLGSGNAEALGNMVVTFTAPVDTVTIRYGNHTTAPANPGQQGISVHDINVCDPFTTLNVSKVSTVISDPVNGTTNPKAIPGATVEYLITVTNTGASETDADSVVVWDEGPADAKMCLISRSGGPVIFADTDNDDGLIYDYGGTGDVQLDLAVTGDDLEFSSNSGTTFDYVPSADAQGCDSAITDFRVRPGGAFSAGGDFTVTVRYVIE